MVDLRPAPARREFRALAATALVVAALSFFGCKDVPTWCLEVLPVFLIAPLAWAVASPPSRLLGRAMFLHALVLVVGAHWTYAEVPAGRVVAQWFGQERNPYDRLGHLMQGFTPAVFAKEWLLRTESVRPVALASAVAVCFALAFSALYELTEWLVAALMGQSSDAFLGTQGFVWDTQADMLCALIGALGGTILLARAHASSLGRIRDELPQVS